MFILIETKLHQSSKFVLIVNAPYIFDYIFNVNHELPLSSLMSVFVQRLANSLHLHDPTLITMVPPYI